MGSLHPDGSSASEPILRAAKSCKTLPPIPIDLFTRAAALVAKRAARTGAATSEVEAILARGLAQARALAGGEKGRS